MHGLYINERDCPYPVRDSCLMSWFCWLKQVANVKEGDNIGL